MTVLFLVSVLALLVATVVNDSLQSMKTVSQSGRDTQAKYAAYAGMEVVMNELRKKDTFVGEEISERHGRHLGSLSELNKVTYDVLIWNNMSEGVSATERDPIDGPNGVEVQSETVYLVSTGSDTYKGEEVLLSSLAGTARRVRPVFEDAAYARSKLIFLGDSLVDAWDSQGGWASYVPGAFPGPGVDPTAGTGGPNQPPTPTTEDYAASIGTDGKSGRTLRLLEESKLNGHFRIGPGIAEDSAFSVDSGTSSGSGPMGGDSTVTYGVSTASSPETQVAGTEKASGNDKKYAEVDDKSTEMPRFSAPYETDDLDPPPTINNPSSTVTQVDKQGNQYQQYVPPAPVPIKTGGYKSIEVKSGQTAVFSSGVYYFQDEMKVSGTIKVQGSDPVIIFVGKKAIFNSAEINEGGATSALQLCFTDELTESSEIDSLIEDLKEYFTEPTAPTATMPTTAGSLEERVRNILTPRVSEDETEGASLLEVTGGNLVASISGKNLITRTSGGEIFGGIMANVVKSKGTQLHQDLALKGSNLMNSGGWSLEGVHQIR